MPNITYIKFTRNFFNGTNGQLPYSAITAHTNVSSAYPDNLILLIEDDGAGNDLPSKSTASVTFMILAWALMLVGFTLCWCLQLFEKKKSLHEEEARQGEPDDRVSSQFGCGSTTDCGSHYCSGDSGNQRSGTQTASAAGRCSIVDDEFERATDRTSDALDHTDVIRRYDLDVESLPSYTIVSGLPTYDDALEEFRKAGIILKPHVPVVKVFDKGAKEPLTPSDSTDDLPSYSLATENSSAPSACICGAIGALQQSQIIELNPEQLQLLSRKRLSLQISFNGQPAAAIRRNSPSRLDLCAQVGRNNLLRAAREQMPEIHRSSSLTFDNERSVLEHRLRKLRNHRGSIS